MHLLSCMLTIIKCIEYLLLELILEQVVKQLQRRVQLFFSLVVCDMFIINKGRECQLEMDAEHFKLTEF